MTAGTLVLDRTFPLNAEQAAAFNAVLEPLGMMVVGARGRELVVKIVDRTIASSQADLPKALLKALTKASPVAGWKNFHSVAYR
jgi:hypothetical protein